MDQSPIFQRIFLLLAALAYINAVHCAHWHKCPNGSYIVTLIESDKPTEIAAANKLRFNMECKANTMAIPRGSSCLRDFAVSYADTSTCYRSLFSGTAPPGDSSNIACPGLVGVGSRGDGKSPLICHFDWLSRNVLHWTDRRRPITVYLAKRSGGPRNATMTWAEASSACNASLLSASFMNVLPLVGAYVRYIADLLNQTRVWASTRHFSLDASSNFTRESRETAGTRLLPLCAEVDECSLAIHNCSTNGQCVNMLASYVCRCNPHFSGIYCTLEDECARGTHNCPTTRVCVDTPASYVCQCKPVFNGPDCTWMPVRECHSKNLSLPFNTINATQVTRSTAQTLCKESVFNATGLTKSPCVVKYLQDLQTALREASFTVWTAEGAAFVNDSSGQLQSLNTSDPADEFFPICIQAETALADSGADTTEAGHAMGESPPKHGASNAATIATAVSTSLLVLIGAVVALIVYKRRDLRMKSHKSSCKWFCFVFGILS
eukprot:scpid78481/ scgid1865/ Fibrillin-2